MARNKSGRITIEDVAAQAGVSTMTVSRFLNDTGPVAARTAAKISDAIESLNYIPHQGARALAARQTNVIGLILPEMDDVFFFQLIRGIQQTAVGNGFDLLLYSSSNPGEIDVLNLPLGPHNTDGLIVFANSLDSAALSRLHAQQFPLVSLLQTPSAELAIPAVAFENKAGAYSMIEHLVACGHKKIAFLAGSAENEDAQWRDAGYRAAMAAHDIVIDTELIAAANFNAETARQIVAQWLADDKTMDAIFAADDVSARGAIVAVQDAGLRVPDDVAVVGFDDALLSQYIDPPLTTVRAPIEEAGRVAVEQLLHVMRNESAESLTLLPTELVIRQSCGWQEHD
jgi:DNA-binding LacI/PurR family transcriptional regulator